MIECLDALGVRHSLAGDLKQHVVMGDVQVTQEVLHELYVEYARLVARPESQRRRALSVREPTPGRPERAYRVRNTSLHGERSGQVDLAHVSRDLRGVASPLEFFIAALCGSLSLEPKQAAALFADNNKYLAHVLGKGVQGVYEPVLGYYQEVGEHVAYLVALLDEKSLVFSLQVLSELQRNARP